jgi:hypothetical protein
MQIARLGFERQQNSRIINVGWLSVRAHNSGVVALHEHELRAAWQRTGAQKYAACNCIYHLLPKLLKGGQLGFEQATASN